MSEILVVDDDLAVLDVMSEMLRLEGHEVTVAENGVDAVQCVNDAEFDLVITDLIMPEKTGKDVLEEMMSDERLKTIPVIVMSAQDDKDIIGECLATGARDYIVKPLRV